MDGIALPCVHLHWLKGFDYHDPFKRHEGKGLEHKIRQAVDAIANGRQVVLTDDKPTLNQEGEVTAFARSRYIAVFEVADVSYTPAEGLKFRLGPRLCHLRP